MKILFYDLIQNSDADDSLKSPALADTLLDASFTITLDATYNIDCIGVGNTDATEITINGETITFSETDKYLNGLYLLTTSLNTNTLTISHNGTYIGRFACGEYVELCASPSSEPGLWSTYEPRRTQSGQVIKGAGGIAGRKIQYDIRYKVNRNKFDIIEEAHIEQIGKGFPLFVLFDIEYNSGNGRGPWERLYAIINKELIFQGAVRQFLYSKKFNFEEAY